ncbi:estrogen-related receptor gamma-like [Diadema antillarum]|uniref:estrogen-related receptor gamma-like n=1 Tax=Diadema antillarum TaxID=105358 RepID=UPI003A8B6EE3
MDASQDGSSHEGPIASSPTPNEETSSDVMIATKTVRVSRVSEGNSSTKQSLSDCQTSQQPRPRSPPDVCQKGSEAAGAVRPNPTDVSFYLNLNEAEAEPWQLTVRALIIASPQTFPYDASNPENLSNIPSTSDGILPPPSAMPAGSATNEDLAKGGNQELLMIIQWAKAIPGFRQLCLEDQMSLLKATFMDLMILRVAYRSMDSYPLIRVTGKHSLTSAECKKLGWGDLSDGTLAFYSTLQTMKLDLPEFCIMNALVLCFPDAPGLTELDNVRALQRRFLECLQNHARDTYPKEPKRYGKLLLRLPTLRKVSNTAMDHLLRMRVTGRVEVTSLVDELTNCTI